MEQKDKEQVLIKLTDLEPSPYNTYMNEDGVSDHDEQDFDKIYDMVGSIKSLGLITPLSVIGPMENGKYQILSGERRYQAITRISQEEGYTGDYDEVACYVVGDANMDKLEQKLIIESANIETRDINKNDHVLNVIDILGQMKSDGKITHKQLIAEMDKYVSCCDRYKRMYRTIAEKGTDSTRELMKSHKTTVQETSLISTLPREVQEVAVDLINKTENNAEKKEVLKVVSAYKEQEKEIKKKNEEAEKTKEKILHPGMDESGAIVKTVDSYIDDWESDTDYKENETEETDIDDLNGDEWLEKINELDPVDLFKKMQTKVQSKDYSNLNVSSVSGNELFKDNSGVKKDKTLEVVSKWASVMVNKQKFYESEASVIDQLRKVIEHFEEVVKLNGLSKDENDSLRDDDFIDEEEFC